MTKRFFIFKVDPKSAEKFPVAVVLNEAVGAMALLEVITGSLAEARNALLSGAYADGHYLILEDTSGVVIRETPPSPKSKITFEPTRKRRKEKAK